MNLKIKLNNENGKVAILNGESIVAEIFEQGTVDETLKIAELFQSSYGMHDLLKSMNETMQEGKSIDGIKDNLNRYMNLFTYNK